MLKNYLSTFQRKIDMNYWYHGGNLEDGKPKGAYLFVTNALKRAESNVREYGGKVYRLRPEYEYLVKEPLEKKANDIKAIHQADLKQLGGALSVFKEYDE